MIMLSLNWTSACGLVSFRRKRGPRDGTTGPGGGRRYDCPNVQVSLPFTNYHLLYKRKPIFTSFSLLSLISILLRSRRFPIATFSFSSFLILCLSPIIHPFPPHLIPFHHLILPFPSLSLLHLPQSLTLFTLLSSPFTFIPRP